MNDIATQAADWLVRLSDENQPATELEQAEFEHWQQADPRHRKAVNSLKGIVDSLQAMPNVAARAAIHAHESESPQQSWQSLAKTLCLVFALSLPLYFLDTGKTLDVWLADKRTGHTEWQTWELSDGSILSLSGNSAVDLDFDSSSRRLKLLSGDLLIDVAHEANRPLEVVTDQGVFRALGTRFLVQSKDDSTVLTVMESRVQVQHGQQLGKDDLKELTNVGVDEQLVIYEDEQTEFRKIDSDKYERNWKTGLIVVDGRPLPEVLDELSRYHTGFFIYDADNLAEIEVMAVLPLNEPERALRLLGESLPIQIKMHTSWLVTFSSDNE